MEKVPSLKRTKMRTESSQRSKILLGCGVGPGVGSVVGWVVGSFVGVEVVGLRVGSFVGLVVVGLAEGALEVGNLLGSGVDHDGKHSGASKETLDAHVNPTGFALASAFTMKASCSA